MPTRPCAGPAPGQPCPIRQLIPVVRGSKTAARCGYCRHQWQTAKDARRPERRTYAEQQRRMQIVDEWVLLNGYVCPGIPGEQPPHPSRDLTAEHINAVAISGNERGPLSVLCRPCNSKLGAQLSRR